jgi:hypothetical protein
MLTEAVQAELNQNPDIESRCQRVSGCSRSSSSSFNGHNAVEGTGESSDFLTAHTLRRCAHSNTCFFTETSFVSYGPTVTGSRSLSNRKSHTLTTGPSALVVVILDRFRVGHNPPDHRLKKHTLKNATLAFTLSLSFPNRTDGRRPRLPPVRNVARLTITSAAADGGCSCGYGCGCGCGCVGGSGKERAKLASYCTY